MTIRNRFDHFDYVRNPGKYQLFRTAIVATNVFTENGKADMEEGKPVSVRFHRAVWNALYRREEPVYLITSSGKVWGYMFASALANFVL